MSDLTAPRSQIDVYARRILLGGVAAVVAIVAYSLFTLLAPKRWDPTLEQFVAFVETERGLEFDHPVNLRWADIAAEIEADRPAAPPGIVVDPWADAHRLLGLVDPAPSSTVSDALTETLAENAGAFYEPWTETIVLPEGTSETALSVTIVHELTHALQHQNGMLGAGTLTDSNDGEFTRTALIEGDAERIAVNYFWSLSETDRQAFLDAVGFDEDVEPPDPGDNFYAASFYASYEIGRPLVETIIETGGIEALNALLRAKDVGTSERLIDPLGASERSAVDAGSEMRLPRGATQAVGDLGALTWFQAIAPQVGTERALDAIVGYDDDAFATFDRAGRTCARFNVAFDDVMEAEQFADVMADLTVESFDIRGTSVEVDICDPIGDPAQQRLGTIIPLVVGSEATSVHLANGEPADVARCAGLALAATIPADQPTTEFIGWDAVIEQAPRFLDDCR